MVTRSGREADDRVAAAVACVRGELEEVDDWPYVLLDGALLLWDVLQAGKVDPAVTRSALGDRAWERVLVAAGGVA